MVPSCRFPIRSHRPARPRRLVPVAALLLFAVVVVGTALAASVTRRQVHLDDGTVWLTSLTDRSAVRYNVRAEASDAAVSVEAARFDVLQHDGATVIDADGEARAIHAATLADASTARIDSRGTLALNGGWLAAVDAATGDVRLSPASDLAAADSRSGPVRMTLGRGGRIAVDAAGTAYGYRPGDGMVLAIAPGDGQPRELGSLTGGRRLVADALTVVGGVPVIVAGDEALWPGGRVALDGEGDGNGTTADVGYALQTPPVDGEQRGWAAVAGTGGVYVVDLDRGSTRFLANGGSGRPAVPVSSQGTVHAAWAQPARNYLALRGPDASDDADFGTLRNVGASDRLVFRVNHRLVLLNDVAAGKAWRPSVSPETLAVAWQSPQTEDGDGQRRNGAQSAKYRHEFDDDCAAQSAPIRATDDEFGVRPGTRMLLDVLRNDELAGCAVLRVSSLTAPGRDDVAVSPAFDGRYLQLDASRAAAGDVRFAYAIDDGHGQTASATVTLRLRDDGNAPPEQVDAPPEYDVERGATRTVNALDGFMDADGDALTLVAARMLDGGRATVSSRADGQLAFHAGGAANGLASVQVTVSDGRLTATGTVLFAVRDVGSLPPETDPSLAAVRVNEETDVDLAPYVHGTSAQSPVLRDVTPPDGMTATMDAEALTVTLRAQRPGAYDVPYVATQGDKAAQGLLRVEAEAPEENDDPPVAVNDVALLDASHAAMVEPLANDRDPAGGVLAVLRAQAEDGAGALDVAVIDHRRVVIQARSVPEAPVAVTYVAANARGTAQGTITVHPPRADAAVQPPRAEDFTVPVRAGGIVEAKVTDHASGSDGDVRLTGELAADDAFRGLAFVTGDAVRYQAPETPGAYKATYTVEDVHGATASGTVTFDVHAADAGNKAPPRPKRVEAQTAAGRSVRIPIALAGIDADGDDVTLLGLGNAAPKLGRIVETQADALVYEAYPDSAGTDTFSYAVEDWTGQRAQAQVRVGVVPDGGGSGVHARDDEITLRPGTEASVAVTANDLADDDEPLTVTVEPRTDVEAHVCGRALCFVTPGEPGDARIVYAARTAAGLTSTAMLTVHVDPRAPIEPPDAYDYRVPPAATIDKRSVDVDVSPWIANPSGGMDELSVGVHESAAAHARTIGGTTLRIELTDQARAVPYTVANTTHGLTATAFIHVPAYGAFPPTPRPKAPRLQVNARETITIPIADHVRVGAGKTVTVDASQPVTATKSDGGELIADEGTLRFTAAADYAGPASITFTAADGPAGTARRTAVITLPITVVGRDVPPPAFSSATVDVEPGEDATVIDLTALTRAPREAYEDETRYTYASPGLSGPVVATVAPAGRLTLAATMDARAGTMASVPIDIVYPGGTVHAGVTVRVVASTRPTARVPDRELRLAAGQSARVEPLAGAFNPFPDEPLTVVGVRGEGLDGLMADADGSDGSGGVTVTAGTAAGTGRVLVTVEDGTHDVSRRVTGTITVTVVAAPGAPLLSPVAQDGRDGMVELRWTPGAANGSPVTEYLVEYDSGNARGAFPCATSTVCRVTGLTNGMQYRFTVKARNDAGWSVPSNAVEGRPDRTPPAPAQVTATGEYRRITVSWMPPAYDGTPPDGYTVIVRGGNGFTASVEAAASPASVPVPDASITDGAAFTATVMARNRAGQGETSPPSAAAKPWGDPTPPSVTLNQGAGGEATSIGVTVSLGDLRNAGCASVTLSGAADRAGASRTLPCAQPVGRFTLDKRELGAPLTVTASVAPERPGASAASGSATMTPSYAVPPPRAVEVLGKGDRCTVRWEPAGLRDGVLVTPAGREPMTAGERDASVSFALSPWKSCGSVAVAQTLNGTRGPAVSAGSAYVRKTPAAIDPRMALRWDADDRSLLHVENGSVELYGQQARMALTIDGQPVEWRPGQRTVRLPAEATPVPGTGGTGWTLAVIGDDPALSASTGKPKPVLGIRPVGPSTPTTTTVPAAQNARSGLPPSTPPQSTSSRSAFTPMAGGLPHRAGRTS
ncbi:Ig-like domain-containing protein [Bifidobacterium avesanii]|uniref:Tandem-95 repeat protein n=1 Tax=Bifidobacterium avesanii TaxID=1798157 RepID=A0A7K3THG3_9BIFI|nr:tandem-95 repeat protein [Bifidobacterium avesanii]KAB8292634.1 large protein with C-terminal fibronectin type III domain [Bifidobacterium avesanii]NEG78538.1 tandem-95 repeat protein [Bifidobacterium avesanii]